MKLAAVDRGDLRRRLGSEGLLLQTGPLAFRVASPLQAVADTLHALYAEHALLPDDAFCDFRVWVGRPRGLRAWLGPQVIFKLDGQQPFLPLPGQQGFALLEWGMNWCVHAQSPQFLTLHSAVLARGDCALMMPAPSGSGKSTLCAALAFSGWRLLSDELALIDPKTGWVWPLPRPISLKNRSVDVIRAFAPQAVFGPVVPDTLKGSVCHVRPPAAAVAAGAQRARPRWLVFPSYEEGAPAQLSPMPRHEAFMAAMAQAFNIDGHGRTGFRLLADLVDRSSCLSLRYGRLHEAMALLDRELRP